MNKKDTEALKRLIAQRDAATYPTKPIKRTRAIETARSKHGRFIGGFPPPVKKWD